MHRWMDWGHGMGWGGGIMGLFFWILLILLVVFLVRLIIGRGRPEQGRQELGGPAREETALDILKKRYAKGEISREEYKQMQDDLDQTP